MALARREHVASHTSGSKYQHGGYDNDANASITIVINSDSNASNTPVACVTYVVARSIALTLSCIGFSYGITHTSVTWAD